MVVIPVRLTDTVIFDLEMDEIRFETFPPGQAETRIIPNATELLGLIMITSR